MIASVSGRVTALAPDAVVIEVGRGAQHAHLDEGGVTGPQPVDHPQTASGQAGIDPQYPHRHLRAGRTSVRP